MHALDVDTKTYVENPNRNVDKPLVSPRNFTFLSAANAGLCRIFRPKVRDIPDRTLKLKQLHRYEKAPTAIYFIGSLLSSPLIPPSPLLRGYSLTYMLTLISMYGLNKSMPVTKSSTECSSKTSSHPRYIFLLLNI
jgi:hypothetical protein